MFRFPVSPRDLFKERAPQMRGWGIPAQTIRELTTSIRDMWTPGAGGWTYEWVLRAEAAEREERWLLAAMLYGGARFPVVCTPERQAALEKQITCYLKAAHTFSTTFERRLVMVTDDHGPTTVPTHVFTPRARRGDRPYPVLLLSGGIDTGKIELHRMAILACRLANARVIAIDMPGTGETPGPLSARADELYERILAAFAGARSDPGRERSALFGISFGGHWAAKLALTGRVDAAVNLGGPIFNSPVDGERALRLPNGMPGSVANAAGLRALPSAREIAELLEPFSFRKQGLLSAHHAAAPLLAINGDADPYVTPEDTLVLARVRGAEAWLFPGAYHCAVEVLPRVLPSIFAFLRRHLHGDAPGARLLEWATRRVLPKRIEG